jgi:hypothetical protein
VGFKAPARGFEVSARLRLVERNSLDLSIDIYIFGIENILTSTLNASYTDIKPTRNRKGRPYVCRLPSTFPNGGNSTVLPTKSIF